jgi:hypothetical protein
MESNRRLLIANPHFKLGFEPIASALCRGGFGRAEVITKELNENPTRIKPESSFPSERA